MILSLFFPSLAFSFGSTALAVRLNDTISTGTIILGFLLTVCTLVGLIYGVKWKVAYEVETKTREAAEAFGEIKDIESKTLHASLLEAKDTITSQAVIIQRLEALPNLERILTLMNDQSAKETSEQEMRIDRAIVAIEAAFQKIILEMEKRSEERTRQAISELRGEA